MKTIENKAKIGRKVKKNQFNLQNFSETTTRFMAPNYPYIKEFIPNTNIRLNYENFTRLQAMPLPVLGQGDLMIRWCYVPMRCAWRGWNKFITQTLNSRGQYNGYVPYFTQETLMNVIKQQADTDFLMTMEGTEREYDFFNGRYYRFTPLGVQVFTVLSQLGYNVSNKSFTGQKYSAMPLLAAARVILDTEINKEWASADIEFISVRAIIESDYTMEVNENNLLKILKIVSTYTMYSPDFVNMAWTEPNGPNNGGPDLQIAGGGMAGEVNTDGGFQANLAVFYNPNNVGAEAVIRQEDINMLKQINKMMKINQIVGVKSWDRLMSIFGIEKNIANYENIDTIKEDKIEIQFGEVMNNSSNDNAELGEYAGRGVINTPEEMEVKYNTKEHGYLIMLAAIKPQIAYKNQIDKQVLRLEPYDFYTQELDAQGVEPIASAEVYMPFRQEMAANEPNQCQKIFGYIPRYADYKIAKNKVHGLFEVLTAQNEFEKWNFVRNLQAAWSSSAQTGSVIIQRLALQRGLNKSQTDYDNVFQWVNQFDRIFYDYETPSFNMYFTFKLEMKATMERLYAFEDIVEDDEKAINIEVQ